ncbi:MAG: hypothetical protein L6R48_04255 [Planctomycetes bacterium]|nr:hypothetical protein [Planctomycetota bacterium]
MRRPRSERIPPGRAGIWHVTSRCVRRELLLEAPGAREWLSGAIAAWLDVLAVDLLGYALMGNHIHLVLRTRPDVARSWTVAEVRRRWVARQQVADGRPGVTASAAAGERLDAADLVAARAELAHPGPLLKAVKEGFARRCNRLTGASGHVWESRYQDVALIDAGGVLACLVYVDLNPFRAGLAEVPAASRFCSARHRRGVDATAEDVVLAARLAPLGGHPLLDGAGEAVGSWSWGAAELAELTQATAAAIRAPGTPLPAWAEALLPRLGLARSQWAERMGVGGTLAGNVLGAFATRRATSPASRMASDKSGLFTD